MVLWEDTHGGGILVRCRRCLWWVSSCCGMGEWWWPPRVTSDLWQVRRLARDTTSEGEGRVSSWSGRCLCWASSGSEGSADSGLEFTNTLNWCQEVFKWASSLMRRELAVEQQCSLGNAVTKSCEEGLGTQTGNSWDWARAEELGCFSGSCSLPVLATCWAALGFASTSYGRFFSGILRSSLYCWERLVLIREGQVPIQLVLAVPEHRSQGTALRSSSLLRKANGRGPEICWRPCGTHQQ